MDKYTVKKYTETDFKIWNDFINQAKNATFLFHRDFMEYHKDRFEDYSLMIFEEKKLVAVLPANKVENSVYSHQGLTYGGLVYLPKLCGENIELILDRLLYFLKQNQVETFYYKPIPVFYCQEGNNAVDFFLFQRGAVLEHKEMNLVVHLELPLHISKSKLKHFRRIENLHLEILEEEDFFPFWKEVLEPRLIEKYNAKPVHTKEEIMLLKQYFSSEIKQFSVYESGKIIAGITIFEKDFVVKSQYGATTKRGQEVRALDFLFINLIERFKQEGKLLFDMGIVNEDNQQGYHSGLLKQKEELGCSIYNQDFYKLTIK